MKNFNIYKIYILYKNEKIIAISEELSEIQKYIDQFYRFFETDSYDIRTEIKNPNYYLARYGNRILYWFTNDIILTDDEISYYRKTIFDEMYYTFITKLKEIMYDPKILEMKYDERRKLILKNEEYFESVKTFELFMNKFDPNVLLQKYITSPII